MTTELQFKQYGECAILIEWPEKIDENILEELIFCQKLIQKNYFKVIIEVILSYNSLLISYKYGIEDFYSAVFELKKLFKTVKTIEGRKKKLWEIPVCYEAQMAEDLLQFLELKKIKKEELIRLHSSSLYTVFFRGFLPGFLYLGGLDEKLVLPRKAIPSREVQSGSVAIGGSQTGIYPVNSPGGWYVIGKTPIRFFDVKNETLSFVSPGDKLKFVAVDVLEYNAISSLVLEGEYQLKFSVV